MKKRVWLAAGIVAGALICSPAMAAENKFGYVSIQKAATESVAGKEATGKLNEQFNQARENLATDEAEIKKLEEALNKQGMMLTDKVRREKLKEYLRRKRNFERSVKDAEAELQLKEEELKDEILEDLIPIVQKYGKENGFTFIFEKDRSSMLFALDELDITDKVIAIYDAQYKKK